MSLAVDRTTVRRLEELAFRGWPALEARDSAGWRLRFAGGYTKRANSINALRHDAETDSASPPEPRGGLPRAPPVAGLAAEPARPAGHGRHPGGARLPHHRAQPAAGLPAACGLRGRPGGADLPQPTPAWIEAFCSPQPGTPGASRRHAAHAGSDRRSGGLRLRRGRGPTHGDGDRRRAGRPYGPVRRAGDAAGAPPRPGAARSPRASMPGPGATAPASPTCRSWRPTHAAMPLYAAQGFRTVYAYDYRVPPPPEPAALTPLARPQ